MMKIVCDNCGKEIIGDDLQRAELKVASPLCGTSHYDLCLDCSDEIFKSIKSFRPVRSYGKKQP